MARNTGVPFANRMSPPVPLLSGKEIQAYTDGQLKWVIDYGIWPSGMPGSKGHTERRRDLVDRSLPAPSAGPPAAWANRRCTAIECHAYALDQRGAAISKQGSCSCARAVLLALSAIRRQAACARLGSLSGKEWQRLLRWLDTSGLALYFLDRVSELKQTKILPP